MADDKPEPSVEEVELLLRKVARGDIPKIGDVLLRAQNGWIFSPALIDVGAIEYDGELGSGIPIGDTGFVKISGENAVPPGEADIYETIVEFGAGNIIEEILDDGELLFKVGGLYTITGTLTYENLNQTSELNMILVRDNFPFRFAQSQANLQGANPFVVQTIQFTGIFQPRDRVYLEFGRASEQNFTAEIIQALLLAYAVSLDVRA